MSNGWVRWENTTPENLKVAPASDKAFRLWFNASCYCSRNKTDGRVPAVIITDLSRTATKRTVDELLELGLLERLDAKTYLIHDYLDFNPSRQRIEEMREATRNRVTEYRKRDSNGVTGDDVTPLQEEYIDVTSHARNRSVSSTDSGSSPSRKETKPEREPSKTVDQDELPTALPVEMRQTASETLRKLEALQLERGGYLPTARGVGLVLIRFPDRDHEAVVRELEYWALAGPGQNRQVKDWVKTLATFLDRTPAGSASRAGNVVQFGGRRPSAGDLIAKIRKAEEAS